MVQSPILITKADGEREPFKPEKLEQSLERAGASSTARARILAHVLQELREGMLTEEIYRHAFEKLRQEEETPVAARYSMKRAIFALGPSGFPFELFFSEVLKAHGWKTRADIMLMGRCAGHEVDVVAEKDGKRVAIEAKFHNDPGGKTDIKDALYVHARHLDLQQSPDENSRVDEGWLVTNTRFTRNAIHTRSAPTSHSSVGTILAKGDSCGGSKRRRCIPLLLLRHFLKVKNGGSWKKRSSFASTYKIDAFYKNLASARRISRSSSRKRSASAALDCYAPRVSLPLVRLYLILIVVCRPPHNSLIRRT
jgi:hypothetical protein